jgi:periplasmic protein TonB
MNKQDSYLELLFENRNKDYGAYELRINYHSRLFKAFAMAVLFAGIVFLIPFLLSIILTKAKPETIVVSIPIDLQKKFIIESEVKPASQVMAHRISENSIRVVHNNEVVQTKPEEKKDLSEVASTTVSDNTSVTPANTNGGPSALADETLILPTSVMSEAALDVRPVFPGGEKALLKFLENNIHFTSLARENNITGKVFASFVVNEKGEIVNIEIILSLEAGLDNEVIRVLNKMPRWSPGIFNGNPVKTAMIIPVSFNLIK